MWGLKNIQQKCNIFLKKNAPSGYPGGKNCQQARAKRMIKKKLSLWGNFFGEIGIWRNFNGRHIWKKKLSRVYRWRFPSMGSTNNYPFVFVYCGVTGPKWALNTSAENYQKCKYLTSEKEKNLVRKYFVIKIGIRANLSFQLHEAV